MMSLDSLHHQSQSCSKALAHVKDLHPSGLANAIHRNTLQPHSQAGWLGKAPSTIDLRIGIHVPTHLLACFVFPYQRHAGPLLARSKQPTG